MRRLLLLLGVLGLPATQALAVNRGPYYSAAASATGSTPSGAAAGDLSGTYPNPTVKGATTNAGLTITYGVSAGSMTIVTTGTFAGLTISGYAFPNQSYQGNNAGLFNITKSSAGPALVIISSAGTVANTDGDTLAFIHQLSGGYNGSGVLRIIDDNYGNSSPQIRVDAYAPNMEVVNLSTDNAHGKGKWEPWAMASGGTLLQVNNRSEDNSGFETLAYWSPLNLTGSGLYLNAQNSSADGGAIGTPDTSELCFAVTANNRNVCLTGPQTAGASFTLAIPQTTGGLGRLMWQSSAGRGGSLNARSMEWSGSEFTYSSTTYIVTMASANVTGNIISGGGFSRGVTTVVGNITLTSTHSLVNLNCPSNCTITLPSAASTSGQEIIFNNVSGSSVTHTITRAGSDVINSTNSIKSNAGTGRVAELHSDGVSKWSGPVNYAPPLTGYAFDPQSVSSMLSSGVVHMLMTVDRPGCAMGIRLPPAGTAAGKVITGIYSVEGGTPTALIAASTQAALSTASGQDEMFTFTISTPGITAAQTTCLPLDGGQTISIAIMMTDGTATLPRCGLNTTTSFQGVLYDGTSRTAAASGLPFNAGILTEANSRCYPARILWANGLTQ